MTGKQATVFKLNSWIRGNRFHGNVPGGRRFTPDCVIGGCTVKFLQIHVNGPIDICNTPSAERSPRLLLPAVRVTHDILCVLHMIRVTHNVLHMV